MRLRRNDEVVVIICIYLRWSSLIFWIVIVKVYVHSYWHHISSDLLCVYSIDAVYFMINSLLNGGLVMSILDNAAGYDL